MVIYTVRITELLIPFLCASSPCLHLRYSSGVVFFFEVCPLRSTFSGSLSVNFLIFFVYLKLFYLHSWKSFSKYKLLDWKFILKIFFHCPLTSIFVAENSSVSLIFILENFVFAFFWLFFFFFWSRMYPASNLLKFLNKRVEVILVWENSQRYLPSRVSIRYMWHLRTILVLTYPLFHIFWSSLCYFLFTVLRYIWFF